MDHVRQSDLIKLASGELDDRRRAEIRAHLEACAACRRLRADLDDVHRLLGEWTVDAAPCDVWAGIERRLDGAPVSGIHPRWRMLPGLSRVAAAVAIGVGLGHIAGRVARPVAPIEDAVPAATTEQEMVADLRLHVLETAAPAGLFTTLFDVIDASGATEDQP